MQVYFLHIRKNLYKLNIGFNNFFDKIILVKYDRCNLT